MQKNTQVNTLASDFTTDVATKQADVTSKYNAFDTDITEANQTIDDILGLADDVQQIGVELNEKANKTQEEWITPTLLNGAVGSYLSYQPFQYRKNQFGNLEFRGLIGVGTYTTNTVIFELPIGYRVRKMTSNVGGTGGSARAITVELSPNGQVKIFGILAGYIVFGVVMAL